MNNDFPSRGELLAETRRQLTEKGMDSAALEARLLLCHCLNISQENLLADDKKSVSTEEKQLWQNLLSRRLNREPLSQIIGSKGFWEDEFRVNRHTLTPRPDSETLIQAVLDYYPDTTQKLFFADIGTGSGCLLLTLLKIFPNAYGVGMDISPDALSIAAENQHRLGLVNRAMLIAGCWLEAIQPSFDMIISNPPYIAFSESDTLEPEVRLYEPASALYGGEDGLQAYRELLPQAAEKLKKGGYMMLECGWKQATDIAKIGEDNHLCLKEIRKDLAERDRCVILKRSDKTL